MFRMRPIFLTTLFLLGNPLIEGTEVKIEGVLKAINTDERIMTLDRKTSKGTKELALEVAAEAGELNHLKAGEEVTVGYDSTLEVVTKIISPVRESAWLLYDLACQDLTPEKACQITDGELRFPTNRGSVMLVSQKKYDTGIFRCEFYYEEQAMDGNPFIGIGCTPPNPKGTSMKEKSPKGMEIKLWHRGFGSLLLPEEQSKVDLVYGQKREGRAVFPLKQQVPTRNGWSTLEIEVKDDKTILVKGNGVLLNAIAKVENTNGHIVIFPPACEFRIRNASIEIDGKNTPLPFADMTLVKCD
jgi:hypothetical protein